MFVASVINGANTDEIIPKKLNSPSERPYLRGFARLIIYEIRIGSTANFPRNPYRTNPTSRISGVGDSTISANIPAARICNVTIVWTFLSRNLSALREKNNAPEIEANATSDDDIPIAAPVNPREFSR